MNFLTGDNAPTPAEINACVFCHYAGPNDVLWDTPSAFVVEPLRQVTPGHVLVIPKAHARDFAERPDITAVAFRHAAEFVQSEELGDCNLITSKGAAASQTVHHIHIHVLPRRWGDNVTLPWGNPNVPPTWGVPGNTRYLLRVQNNGITSTTSRLAKNALQAVREWEEAHPNGGVIKAERMFPKKDD